jgi:hypothetical protein
VPPRYENFVQTLDDLLSSTVMGPDRRICPLDGIDRYRGAIAKNEESNSLGKCLSSNNREALDVLDWKLTSAERTYHPDPARTKLNTAQSQPKSIHRPNPQAGDQQK